MSNFNHVYFLLFSCTPIFRRPHAHFWPRGFPSLSGIRHVVFLEQFRGALFRPPFLLRQMCTALWSNFKQKKAAQQQHVVPQGKSRHSFNSRQKENNTIWRCQEGENENKWNRHIGSFPSCSALKMSPKVKLISKIRNLLNLRNLQFKSQSLKWSLTLLKLISGKTGGGILLNL